MQYWKTLFFCDGLNSKQYCFEIILFFYFMFRRLNVVDLRILHEIQYVEDYCFWFCENGKQFGYTNALLQLLHVSQRLVTVSKTLMRIFLVDEQNSHQEMFQTVN